MSDSSDEKRQKEYFVPHIPAFGNDSPFLVSSSRWLNNPLAREYVAKQALRRNHKDVPTTYDITEALPLTKPFYTESIMKIEELFTIERKKNAALDAFFEERHMSTYTMESLKEYPQGSVGWFLQRYLELNGYKADFVEGQPLGPTQFEYFQRRLSQQHDVEHLLGGFPLHYLGEVGVTYMRVGSYFKYLSPELAGLLNTNYAFLLGPLEMRTWLHYPETYNAYHDVVHQGITVGRQSEPVFLMKYEPILGHTPAEARVEMGYRGVIDMTDADAAMADIWSEGTKVAIDPRVTNELLEAAE
jgi:ubiquinone biosynthesis protein COQ4